MSELTTSFQDQQPEQETALSGLYLGRKFKGNNPYQTLSDVGDRATAQAMMQQTYSQVEGDNMDKRRRVEPWLKEGAIHGGVQMERVNPIYYSIFKDLNQFEEHVRSLEGFNAIVHKLDDVDLSGWTFTMDDSFACAPLEVVLQRSQQEEFPSHPLHGKVLTENDLLDFLTNDGFPDKLPGGFPRYIEAQMWTQVPNLINNKECPAVNFTPPPQLSSPHQ